MIRKMINIDEKYELIYNCIPNKSQEMRNLLEKCDYYVKANREKVLAGKMTTLKEKYGKQFEDLDGVVIEDKEHLLEDFDLDPALFGHSTEDVILAKILIIEKLRG